MQQFLVRDIAPQETRPNQMQGAAGDDDVLTLGHIDVGQVGREREVVGFDGGTEQQGARVPEVQDELRQVPCATEKNTVLTETQRFDIAITVEYGKTVSVFKYPRAVVGWGRSGRYVVLLGGANFIQLRSPSVSASDSGSGFVMRS